MKSVFSKVIPAKGVFPPPAPGKGGPGKGGKGTVIRAKAVKAKVAYKTPQPGPPKPKTTSPPKASTSPPKPKPSSTAKASALLIAKASRPKPGGIAPKARVPAIQPSRLSNKELPRPKRSTPSASAETSTPSASAETALPSETAEPVPPAPSSPAASTSTAPLPKAPVPVKEECTDYPAGIEPPQYADPASPSKPDSAGFMNLNMIANMAKEMSSRCRRVVQNSAQVLQPAKPSQSDPVDDPETLHKMANLEQELAQARATEDMLRDQLNSLDSQYEEAREEDRRHVADAKQKLADAQRERAQLEAERDKALAAHRVLEEELADARQTSEQIQAESEVLRKQNTALEEKNAALEEKSAAQQEEIAKLKSELEQGRVKQERVSEKMKTARLRYEAALRASIDYSLNSLQKLSDNMTRAAADEDFSDAGEALQQVMQDPMLPPLLESLGIGPASEKAKALESIKSVFRSKGLEPKADETESEAEPEEQDEQEEEQEEPASSSDDEGTAPDAAAAGNAGDKDDDKKKDTDEAGKKQKKNKSRSSSSSSSSRKSNRSRSRPPRKRRKRTSTSSRRRRSRSRRRSR